MQNTNAQRNLRETESPQTKLVAETVSPQTNQYPRPFCFCISIFVQNILNAHTNAQRNLIETVSPQTKLVAETETVSPETNQYPPPPPTAQFPTCTPRNFSHR